MPNDQHLGGCSPSSPNALNLTIDDKCEHWLISLPNDKQVHQMLTKFTKWSTTSVPNTYQVCQFINKFTKCLPSWRRDYWFSSEWNRWLEQPSCPEEQGRPGGPQHPFSLFVWRKTWEKNNRFYDAIIYQIKISILKVAILGQILV